MTIPGLMQQRPLQVIDILRFAASAHPARDIVSRQVHGPIWRYGNADLHVRVTRLAAVLHELGVRSGDRVTSLAWNTHRHLELFYAVPGSGAVLHTANPRLADDQIVFTICHAGSKVIFYDETFAPLIERLKPRLENIEVFVLLSAAASMPADREWLLSYETLLEGKTAMFDWPSLDENSGAFLCYTSGTVGNPKGVLYSHRSVVLHALAAGLSGALGFSAFDNIMPCQSLYHATGWGLPFVAAINGCKLVLPCEKMDGASLQELIMQEEVTFSGGVPTIWTMYLNHLASTGEGTGSLQRLVIGGSAVPRAMAETFERRYGVKILQLWGMTETSPLGVIATPTPRLATQGQEAVDEVIWTRQGRMQFGIELRVVDERGGEVPRDGQTPGALLVRGPWVIERYYGSDISAVDAEGWFDTGDVVTLDADGFMRIVDRTKDIIKSGGEWVSSIDLENIAAGYPGVKYAAVIGVAHPKWEERPILIVEPHAGGAVEPDAVLKFLDTRVVSWWKPDRVIVAEVTLTATGKIDKKLLRNRYKDILQRG